jgi:urease accessory protein
MAPDPIPKIHAGSGRIVLSSYGSNVAFSELSSTYPLKLLAPRTTQGRVAVVYLLTYGGGLVGGDLVNLSTEVGSNSVLVVLSQVGFFECMNLRNRHNNINLGLYQGI